MNKLQKLSWFTLIVIFATIIITLAVGAIEFHIRGYSTIAFWFFVIPLLLLKLKPFLFKKPQGRDKVVLDERDINITKRALAIAYKIFWYVFISFCFLLFLIIGPRGSVPTITLPLMAIGGALFLKIVCSVAILIQYGRANKGVENE